MLSCPVGGSKGRKEKEVLVCKPFVCMVYIELVLLWQSPLTEFRLCAAVARSRRPLIGRERPTELALFKVRPHILCIQTVKAVLLRVGESA